MRLVTITFLIIAAFSFGCGKSEKQLQQEKSFQEAVAALRKVDAATQVGVNYQQYGLLLIEAKMRVNEAVNRMNEDDKKNQLNEVMQSYQDAATLWQVKIKNPSYDQKMKVAEIDESGKSTDYSFDGQRSVKEIAAKYKLKITNDGTGSVYRGGSNGNFNANTRATPGKYVQIKYSYIDLENDPMQSCWLWSSQKLNALDKPEK